MREQIKYAISFYFSKKLQPTVRNTFDLVTSCSIHTRSILVAEMKVSWNSTLLSMIYFDIFFRFLFSSLPLWVEPTKLILYALIMCKQ